jgi:hypothetical protein
MAPTLDLRAPHGMREFGSEQPVPTTETGGRPVIVRHNYSGTFSVLDGGSRALLDVFDSYPAAWRDADHRARAR